MRNPVWLMISEMDLLYLPLGMVNQSLNQRGLTWKLTGPVNLRLMLRRPQAQGTDLSEIKHPAVSGQKQRSGEEPWANCTACEL